MIHSAICINPNLTSEECGISEQRLDNMKHKVYSIIDKGNKEYNKKLNIQAHTYYILDEEIVFQFKEEWLISVFWEVMIMANKSKKINIFTLKNIKITKVKQYAIFFIIGHKNYLLHCANKELGEIYYELYERKINNNGYYELKFINSIMVCNSNFIQDFILGKFYNNPYHDGMTYKEIDIMYFVKMLVKYKFAKIILIEDHVENKFLNECKQISEEIFNKNKNGKYDYKKNLQHLKERYKNKINTLHEEYSITDGEDYFYNEGVIEGLKTAIHDIEYILNEMES